jgi:hypothetical protein
MLVALDLLSTVSQESSLFLHWLFQTSRLHVRALLSSTRLSCYSFTLSRAPIRLILLPDHHLEHDNAQPYGAAGKGALQESLSRTPLSRVIQLLPALYTCHTTCPLRYLVRWSDLSPKKGLLHFLSPLGMACHLWLPVPLLRSSQSEISTPVLLATST